MHVVIIGNGIAGITTARTLRKKNSDCRITVISSESRHFYSRTALMYIYMGHMKYEHTKPYEDWFWEKNRIDLCFDHVEKIQFENKLLQLRSGQSMTYDKLVIAAGSVSTRHDWPGQEADGVISLYGLQDLKLLEKYSSTTKRAVIVGGGLIGIELAEMLRTRNIEVTYLVRETYFRGNLMPAEEGKMITDHIRLDHHIDLRVNTELKQIYSDSHGRVEAIETSGAEIIPCQLLGIAVGVKPNVAFLKDSGLEIDSGILVNELLETNVPDVYACGDCIQHRKSPRGRKAVEQVWYSGRMMGECLGETLAGINTPYRPGVWFNSAKFFDIEYQTYGEVPAKLRQDKSDFYWQHHEKKVALHFVFQKESSVFTGINSFGIRLRHAVMERWINERKTIEYVLTHFRDAWFEPEFHKNYSPEIIAAFNQKTGSNLKVEAKSWKRILSHIKSATYGH
jgi:NADPH-dependent 2,4-dienoyl-CoA reductase/sulfur reductase-like enzyme